jgi:hypothetical protein
MTPTQQVNIIKALADIASQGTYQAELINFIEAEETNNDSE